MIRVGTSGYSFRDWVGPFYPPGTPARDMLSIYARRFGVVEINSTYYRLPRPEVTAAMVERTPPGFLFAVKAPGELTHGGSLDPELLAAFEAVLAPLAQAGRLAGVLAQFPYRFRAGEDERAYLRAVHSGLQRHPLFVEFRHASWARRSTFALLDELKVGFCAVDEPRLRGLFPPIVRPTGPVGYVRLHGRNTRDWWEGGSRRYDYLYSDDELREWAGAIRALDEKSRETFVFFNNCHAGQAAQNALRMEEILWLDPSGGPGEAE